MTDMNARPMVRFSARYDDQGHIADLDVVVAADMLRPADVGALCGDLANAVRPQAAPVSPPVLKSYGAGPGIGASTGTMLFDAATDPFPAG